MTEVQKKKAGVFWLENPTKLLSSTKIFPTAGMDKAEKLNALTRLALLITAVLYLFDYDQAGLFAILSLLVLVCLNYVGTGLDGDNIEHFTLTPTYLSDDLEQTVAPPLFAEEWQVPPPAYDLQAEHRTPSTFEEPLKPQSYPYGQYLTKTNLLPSDEYYTHQNAGGARQARDYANSAFLRHSLVNQENMTRIYKKTLERRFKHNCQDTVSPYSSY